MSRTVFLNARFSQPIMTDFEHTVKQYLENPRDCAAANMLLQSEFVARNCRACALDVGELELGLMRVSQLRHFDAKSRQISLLFAYQLDMQRLVLFYLYQVPIDQSTFSFFILAEERPVEYLVENYQPCSQFFIALQYLILQCKRQMFPKELFAVSLHTLDSAASMHLLNALFYLGQYQYLAQRQALKALQLFTDAETTIAALRLLRSCMEASDSNLGKSLLRFAQIALANMHSVNAAILGQQIEMAVSFVQTLNNDDLYALCEQTSLFDSIIAAAERVGTSHRPITEALCDLVFCLRHCVGVEQIADDFCTLISDHFSDSLTVKQFLLEFDAV